jgi:hypothetical protein
MRDRILEGFSSRKAWGTAGKLKIGGSLVERRKVAQILAGGRRSRLRLAFDSTSGSDQIRLIQGHQNQGLLKLCTASFPAPLTDIIMHILGLGSSRIEVTIMCNHREMPVINKLHRKTVVRRPQEHIPGSSRRREASKRATV